jgi:LuxR family maltose regulon positive regulatory protein
MSGKECFRVRVLGRFGLFEGDTPITLPPRLRKPQELLQALIALGGTEVSADVLVDALWPDSEGDAA